MQASIERFLITEMLIEHHIFRSQHCFTAHIIRIHTLPSARQRTTVENHHQPVIVRITQNIFIQPHCLLLVTAEEINLDSLHTETLQPFHFTFTDDCIIHPVHRSLFDVIPIAGRTVPQEQLNTFTACILNQRLHTLMPDSGIPPVIDQRILISHSRGKINVTYLIIIVDTAVLPKNPAPRATPETIIMFCFIKRAYHIPRNGCFHNRLQMISHCDGTPRSSAGQRKSRSDRSVSIIFFRHRKGDRI